MDRPARQHALLEDLDVAVRVARNLAVARLRRHVLLRLPVAKQLELGRLPAQLGRDHLVGGLAQPDGLGVAQPNLARVQRLDALAAVDGFAAVEETQRGCVRRVDCLELEQVPLEAVRGVVFEPGRVKAFRVLMN